MTTPWTLPSIISQYSEPGAETADVAWDDTQNFQELLGKDNRSLQSMSALEHTARSPKRDIENKTYYLKLTGFNFSSLPATLSGIEARLTARRYGRATDDTIELCLNGKNIGKNKADLIISPEKIYGGENDIWNAENLSIADLSNSTFGILIRFKAHPDWPHKSPVLIDSVELRIH